MPKSIAFLTAPNYQTIVDKCPDFLDEFKLLQPIFAEHNINLVQANWQDNALDWAAFAAIVPKACWDYMFHPTEFTDFLTKILRLGVPMVNDAKTVLWNMRKSYLLDLQKLNLPIAELVLIPHQSKVTAADLVAQLKQANLLTPTLVAKPSIGGAAVDTMRFNREEIASHEALFNKILGYADLILQPYFPEITAGEYSYFFFNSHFSHAVVKKPALGDYRAHQLFGANNLTYQPDDAEIAQAFQFVSAIPPQRYARVDAFKKDGQLFLLELELIEPYLYFEHAPESAVHAFCQAVIT